MSAIPYSFSAKPWEHAGPGSWHFVALPKKLAKEIRKTSGNHEEGWGRLKATARIGQSEWKTAIWFDTKQDTYLLPLKAEVRKKETIQPGKRVSITVWV